MHVPKIPPKNITYHFKRLLYKFHRRYVVPFFTDFFNFKVNLMKYANQLEISIWMDICLRNYYFDTFIYIIYTSSHQSSSMDVNILPSSNKLLHHTML
jgi:hypothetical protein